MSKHEFNKTASNMSQKVVGNTLLVKPLEDLSLTPPPLLETGSDQPPQPPGHPDPSQGDFSSKNLPMKFSEISPKSMSFFSKKTHETRETSRFLWCGQNCGTIPDSALERWTRVPINLGLEDSGNFSCEVWKIDFQSSKSPGAKRFVFEQLNQVLHDARCCRFVHPKTYNDFVTASGSPNRCQDPDSAVSADPRPTCLFTCHIVAC